MSSVGKIVILHPKAGVQSFDWYPCPDSPELRTAIVSILGIARKRAKRSVKSTSLSEEGAVLSVLAQYTATGLLRSGEDGAMMAALALLALQAETNHTNWVFTLNEGGQVIQLASL